MGQGGQKSREEQQMTNANQENVQKETDERVVEPRERITEYFKEGDDENVYWVFKADFLMDMETGN